jgi:hypothetical protein
VISIFPDSILDVVIVYWLLVTEAGYLLRKYGAAAKAAATIQLRKLLQKLHIILKQQPNIFNTIKHHGLALYAHSEGETRVFF